MVMLEVAEAAEAVEVAEVQTPKLPTQLTHPQKISRSTYQPGV